MMPFAIDRLRLTRPVSKPSCKHPFWTEVGDGHGHNSWRCTDCGHSQWVAPWVLSSGRASGVDQLDAVRTRDLATVRSEVVAISESEDHLPDGLSSPDGTPHAQGQGQVDGPGAHCVHGSKVAERAAFEEAFDDLIAEHDDLRARLADTEAKLAAARLALAACEDVRNKRAEGAAG